MRLTSEQKKGLIAKGKRSYDMRRRARMYWCDIAKQPTIDFNSGARCKAWAKRYAEENDLQWPIGTPLTKSEMAYRDFELYGNWSEVRRTLGLPTAEHARKYAQKYAERKNEPWPPVLKSGVNNGK